MAELSSIFSRFRTFRIPEIRFISAYPNSCSSGCLLKTDFIDEHNIHYYVKLPHRAKNNSWGMESLNEVICSRLGEQLDLPVLHYEPCMIDLMNGEPLCFGCYSESYAEKGVIALDSMELCESEFGPHSTDADNLRKLGYSSLVDTIILWDFLIGGTDRHARNIEFLSYPDGSIRPAPIFDNGKSLLTTYGAYPKSWDLEQYTNNFLTCGYKSNTFKTVQSVVHLSPLVDVDWDSIKKNIENELSVNQWSLIVDFINHNYTILLSKGLII